MDRLASSLKMRFCVMTALVSLTTVAPCHAALADDANILRLGTEASCDDSSGDTPSMDACLKREIAKADRWRLAIIDSYMRMAHADTAEMSQNGAQPPYDTIALLAESEAAFERYRDQASNLVQGTGLAGSGNSLLALQAQYRLTIDHIRFLWRSCMAKPRWQDLGDKIDLSRTDWCAPGGTN